MDWHRVEEIQLSCRSMTVWAKVGVRQHESKTVIIDAAPIIRRFIGQSVSRVIEWMRRHSGEVTVSVLHPL